MKHRPYFFYVLLALSMTMLTRCDSHKDANANNIEDANNKIAPAFTLISEYPHDTASFTEGLVFNGNTLFESTGSPDEISYTTSVFGPVDLSTGKIAAKQTLDKKYFGEGISFLGSKLYYLTYESQTGFIYDTTNFAKSGEFHFDNKEGWGLTTDGTNLIMSDGSNSLTFMQPPAMKVSKKLFVQQAGKPVNFLNELEYVKGFIYANIYGTNVVAKIDPANGEVISMIDLSSLANNSK